MIALPIVVRELRVAARRDSTYWTRLAVAFFSILIGAYGLVVFQPRFGRAGGAMLFHTFSWIAVLYCLVIGLRNSSDCMSEEKREGTLGLLFLTDLSGYDVVLGKLIGIGLNSFYSFLAAFPVLSFSMVLGGVTWGQFWRTALALLNLFFFAHAAGLLVSTFSRQSRKAFGGTVLLAVVFIFGVSGAVALLRHFNYTGWSWLGLLNPCHPFSQVAATRGSAFWLSLSITHALSWAFLAVASWHTPRSWQERTTARRLLWRERLHTWCCGNSKVRKQFRDRLVNVNPFFWLVSRTRLGPTWVWGTLGLLGCLWLSQWLSNVQKLPTGRGWQTPFVIMTLSVLHTVIKFWFASASACHFSEQRRNGSLEFLLSCTPLSVSDIIRGQWLALRRQFFGPVLAILAFDFLLLMWSSGFDDGTRHRTLFFYIVGAMVMLVADGFALGWVGMWLGLSSKKPKHAAGSAILRVVFLPWIIFAWCGAGMHFGNRLESVVILFPLLSIVNDAIWGVNAATKLNSRFRELAAPQREESLGILGRIGRRLGEIFGGILGRSPKQSEAVGS